MNDSVLKAIHAMVLPVHFVKALAKKSKSMFTQKAPISFTPVFIKVGWEREKSTPSFNQIKKDAIQLRGIAKDKGRKKSTYDQRLQNKVQQGQSFSSKMELGYQVFTVDKCYHPAG